MDLDQKETGPFNGFAFKIDLDQKNRRPLSHIFCKSIKTVCKMPLTFVLNGRATISYSTCAKIEGIAEDYLSQC